MSIDVRITKWMNAIPKGNRDLWFFVSIYGLLAFPLYFFGFWMANGHRIVHLLVFVSIVLLSPLIGGILQVLVKRPRPDFMYTDYVPRFKKYSFPSIHALSAFSMATTITLFQYLENGVSIPFLASAIFLFSLAKLIALSRIMVGVHYYGDILAGGVIGVLFGCLTFLL